MRDGRDSRAVRSAADDAELRLACQVLDLLKVRGQTLAVAESLTGGLVSAALTAVPGASRAMRGSVTAYATEVKQRVLGVDGKVLAEQGAVAPEVARQLATGVRELLAADWGLSTTGVAGPTEQDGRPVGTVYVAVAPPGTDRAVAQRLFAEGDRAEIRVASVRTALTVLRNALIEDGFSGGTQAIRESISTDTSDMPGGGSYSA
jgi:nicotinamide-nucleotide amidase